MVQNIRTNKLQKLWHRLLNLHLSRFSWLLLMCTLALWCFPSLLSNTFYTFQACQNSFSLYSWLLLTLLCSSRVCALALDILITTVRILINLHFDSQVCFWMNHFTCTQGFFPAQVERSLECQESGLMLLHMLQKNAQSWRMLHVMYSILSHSYVVAQYFYNASCNLSYSCPSWCLIFFQYLLNNEKIKNSSFFIFFHVVLLLFWFLNFNLIRQLRI